MSIKVINDVQPNLREICDQVIQKIIPPSLTLKRAMMFFKCPLGKPTYYLNDGSLGIKINEIHKRIDIKVTPERWKDIEHYVTENDPDLILIVVTLTRSPYFV